jgi:hypothetical protein
MSEFKTFILAGQSNMAGLGNITEIPEYLLQTPSNVFYAENKTYKKFAEPRFGPEITFAHEIAKAWSAEKILIVKYAVGSSSLLDWSPHWSYEEAKETHNEDYGSLYFKLIKYIEIAWLGKEAEFKGILWMQGERDAKFKNAAVQYKNNLKTFIHKIREDLHVQDLPFIIGQVNPPEDEFPFASVVCKAQHEIEKEIPNTKLVYTNDLQKLEDGLHYASEGLIELGQRFAQTFLEDIAKLHRTKL